MDCLANAHTCGIPSLQPEGPEYLHQVFPFYKPSQKEGELTGVMDTTWDSGAATALSVALHWFWKYLFLKIKRSLIFLSHPINKICYQFLSNAHLARNHEAAFM